MATMKTKRVQSASREKDTAPVNEAPTTHTHVGDVLREAREERNLTLEMVADELMIRRFYLECLEKGSFRDLPERVYAMGFVRNYASLLGLDPRALVEQFKRDAYGTRQGNGYLVELNMPEPVVHSVVPGRSAMITALVVLVLLVGGVVWMAQEKKVVGTSIPEPSPVHESAMPDMLDDAPASAAADAASTPPATGAISDTATPAPDAATTTTATPPVADAFVSAEPAAPAAPVQDAPAATDPVNTVADSATPVSATPAAGTTDGGLPPAIANVKNERILEALQSSWVEVRDDKNTILFTSILKSGQILPLPDSVRLTVTTGNAGGLRLIVKGKAMPAFGAQNEVKRNIVLDPQAAQLDQR